MVLGGVIVKNFKRENNYLSLCGLNCGLCSMRLSGHCPGCGRGEHHSCAVAKCSIQHGRIEYCFLCDEFPCVRYLDADKYDSFITHQNQFKDIEKAKNIGIQAYTKEQIEKVELLNWLLENCNAGRQKSFFCIAVNLLDYQNIKAIIDHLSSNKDIQNMPIKEKAAYAVAQFQNVADKKGVELKLRKKPTSKK